MCAERLETFLTQLSPAFAEAVVDFLFPHVGSGNPQELSSLSKVQESCGPGWSSPVHLVTYQCP